MDNINVDIALQEWADGVVKTAKKNLAKQGKNTSKKLSNSIKAEANNGTLIFYFEEYEDCIEIYKKMQLIMPFDKNLDYKIDRAKEAMSVKI